MGGLSPWLQVPPETGYTSNLEWGKAPMWPAREKIIIPCSQGRKTDLEFCNKVKLLTSCVSKILRINLLYYRLNHEFQLSLCMIKLKERSNIEILVGLSLYNLAKLDGALLNSACKWNLKQLKQNWQYVNISHGCTYYLKKWDSCAEVCTAIWVRWC